SAGSTVGGAPLRGRVQMGRLRGSRRRGSAMLGQDEAIRLDDVQTVQLATGQVAFCGPEQSLVVDAGTAQVLASCTLFATVTEHAVRLGLAPQEHGRLGAALQAADD